MTVTVLSLSARGGGEEIAVIFEICQGEYSQKETLVISAADLADLRLAKGEASPEIFDRAQRAAGLYGARKRALAILNFGRCSRRRLIQKLCAKGVEREFAEVVAARLSAEGYLDEGADAIREAERDFAKLWGARRIKADLLAKGYHAEAIQEALFALEDGGADYPRACAERIVRTWGDFPTDPKEKQKAIAALQRAGFSFSEIKESFHYIK